MWQVNDRLVLGYPGLIGPADPAINEIQRRRHVVELPLTVNSDSGLCIWRCDEQRGDDGPDA